MSLIFSVLMPAPPPPHHTLLPFEVSTSFAEIIKCLDDIQSGFTCGFTCFVEARGHYVSYIPYKEEILFYDGLPKDNPVLRIFRLKQINGDVSLLCYIPLDYFEISNVDPSKSNVNAGDDRKQSGIHSTAASSKTADIAFEVNE